MKTLLLVLGLLVLVPSLALAQATGTYYVDYFANNTGAPGTLQNIINVGTLGTPLTSPVGDICVNAYFFTADQEMIECCAVRITPNELFQGNTPGGTINPLTAVIPTSGVVKLVAVPPPSGGCDPRVSTTTPDARLVTIASTHLNWEPYGLFVTETQLQPSPLSAAEEGFLQTACSFVLYLGSGRGNCLTGAPLGPGAPDPPAWAH
jgi:hypothetical protein